MSEQPVPNCATADPDLFFPETTAEYKVKVPLAKKICSGCPVVVACFMQAMSDGSPGIWGGTTEAERKGYKYNSRSKKIYLDSITMK